MNRTTGLVLCALFFMLSASCSAQISIGVIGGLNIADMKSSSKSEAITVGTAGLVCDIPLFAGGSLYLQPKYLAGGARLPETATEPDRLLSVSYIELPVFLKYSFGTPLRPYLLAGPCASILTSSDVEITVGTTALKGDSKSITKSGDFLFCFGAGCSYSLGSVSVFLEGQYAAGLADVVKSGSFVVSTGTLSQTITLDDDEDVKNKGFRILLGISFEL